MKPCHDLTQLNAFQGPKVILASLPDMESGYSRELFVQNFASNPKNLVIFTIEPTPGSLSDQVLNQNNKTLTVQVIMKIFYLFSFNKIQILVNRLRKKFH